MQEVKAKVEFKMKCESVRSGNEKGRADSALAAASTAHLDQAENITGGTTKFLYT
jgi:hypothetical protein